MEADSTQLVAALSNKLSRQRLRLPRNLGSLPEPGTLFDPPCIMLPVEIGPFAHLETGILAAQLPEDITSWRQVVNGTVVSGGYHVIALGILLDRIEMLLISGNFVGAYDTDQEIPCRFPAHTGISRLSISLGRIDVIERTPGEKCLA